MSDFTALKMSDSTVIMNERILIQCNRVKAATEVGANISSIRLVLPAWFYWQGWMMGKKIISIVNEYIVLLMDIPPTQEMDWVKIKNDLHKAILLMDNTIGAGEEEGLNFYRKQFVLGILREQREKLLDLWDDFETSTNEAKSSELMKSQERMKAGDYITHDEFIKRVNVSTTI